MSQSPRPLDPERQRLAEVKEGVSAWRRWGTYLAERQWGNPREDYSADGSAWSSFPHDHARSRVYRWAEDGLLGFSDDQGRLCLALALWNEADPIIKERAFGLTNEEGNHGEDVKEVYFYLDNTPTHSYAKALYKYPQRPFPYEDLIQENRRRDRSQPEYELLDTGIFGENRYFDVIVEYAKAAPEDLIMRITATNRGPQTAPLHLLPTLWFRNTWSWGKDPRRPKVEMVAHPSGASGQAGRPDVRWARASHSDMGDYVLACAGAPELLFADNETNAQRLWGVPNQAPYVKDGINDWVVHGADTVNPDLAGTRMAAHYSASVAPGESATVWLRLAAESSAAPLAAPFGDAEEVLARRQSEAEHFYAGLAAARLDEDTRRVQRQAFAGLLWSKQFYHYDVSRWLEGDSGQPTPPPERKRGRNTRWFQLKARDVLVMPDTWEFPWMASWDLAFHCVALSFVDPESAKRQLLTVLGDNYQHANGQVPAYEWEFSDINPPVQAWAAWSIYQNEQRLDGKGDREFLEKVFTRLLLNFTWWVNREDPDGRNVFQGGFLGLDNIGVFDRSARLPGGQELEQADGTAWMGVYCVDLLSIALELAKADHAYEDIAAKFFEHFLYIAGALNNLGGEGVSLWNEEDEFFYDALLSPDSSMLPLRVRSLVGLLPLLAVETLESRTVEALPVFASRVAAFLEDRPDLADLVARWHDPERGDLRLLSLVHGHRMKSLLRRMLDPGEFLSDFGIRSLSKHHADNPYVLDLGGTRWTIHYDPGESTSWLYGGNSNWRGPVWFPTGYLLIQALREYYSYYGNDYRVECPTGSGRMLNLAEVADELARRMIGIFVRNQDGRRPVFAQYETLQLDPYWRDCIWFHEYFHGDTGAGLGASHQTGWTALVAALIEQSAQRLID